MDKTAEILQTLFDNWGTILSIITVIIAIVRLTAWGKANKEALDNVVEAIETIDSKEVKEAVKASHKKLPTGSANALTNSVQKADSTKPTPGAVTYMADIAGVRARQE